MELLLNKTECLGLGKDSSAVQVTCTSGTCWLTRAGDSRDYILGAGKSFPVGTGRKVVIMAVEPSLIELTRPHTSAAADRFFPIADRLLRIATKLYKRTGDNSCVLLPLKSR